MADVSDVVDTLVGMVSGFLYPNGVDNPSPTGVDSFVYAGWPQANDLKPDLAKGRCHISIYPWAGERNTTRYLLKQEIAQVQTPTISIASLNTTATLSGTIPPASNPHGVMIFANRQP